MDLQGNESKEGTTVLELTTAIDTHPHGEYGRVKKYFLYTKPRREHAKQFFVRDVIPKAPNVATLEGLNALGCLLGPQAGGRGAQQCHVPGPLGHVFLQHGRPLCNQFRKSIVIIG